MKAMRMIGNARARFTEAKEIERANEERLVTIQPEILGGSRERQPIYHAIIH